MSPKDGHAASGGMEIQVLDHRGTKYNHKTDEGKTLTWLKPWQVHGSIYGIMPAATGYLKPLDQWNQQTIICIEDHIKVILNGARHCRRISRRRHSSRWQASPWYAQQIRPHHARRGHSDRMEFKNLKVAGIYSEPDESGIRCGQHTASRF